MNLNAEGCPPQSPEEDDLYFPLFISSRDLVSSHLVPAIKTVPKVRDADVLGACEPAHIVYAAQDILLLRESLLLFFQGAPAYEPDRFPLGSGW